MLLGELTMEEFRKRLKVSKTLVIPFGTIEAHGSHLPLNTDTLIIREAARGAAEKAGSMMAPPIQYGVCTSTSQHPGTIGLTPRGLRLIIKEIVRDAYRQGLRNFILVSGHGGGLHVGAMREAAEALTIELDRVKIAALSVYEMLGKEIGEIAETPNDSHAGELETSLMLYLAPRLVKGRARQEYPKFPKPLVVKDKQRYWRGAVWGDPGKATVDKGEKLFSAMVDKIAGLIKDVEKF